MSFKNELLTLPSASFGGENPLPAFRERKPTTFDIVGEFPEKYKEGAGVHTKILPYTVQDRYDRVPKPRDFKCLTLENDYLRAEFLPELGGRLHRLYDKKLGRELLFTNTVIQPANLAIRNAWLSGGIEWNIGSLGHTFTTCDNVFAAALDDGEGNTFIRIYEFERLKSLFWQVDFHLPESSPHLIVHVKMMNPFNKATTTYWWTNVAVPDSGSTRVFNSGEEALCIVGQEMSYGKIPYELEFMKCDVSYPSRASRSFDFFVQAKSADECTWEASSYKDGTFLYERSTPPLTYKKLYTWGNHKAGAHWQEYLSEPGKGYYAELQAGIAPSQLHDKIMPANTVYEWTQVFGGAECDDNYVYHDDYAVAKDHICGIIDARISAKDILELDKKLSVLAALPVKEDEILHTGSGFGALEGIRMKMDGDAKMPTSLLFPESSIGKNEAPWLKLLRDGKLPNEAPESFTASYMTSEKWLPHIEASLERPGGKNWYSLMQYGVAIYDGCDHTQFATDAYDERSEAERVAAAEAAWLESVAIQPSVIVLRNLAVLENQRGCGERAIEYFERALKLPGVFDDFAFFTEFLTALCEHGMYERGGEIYKLIPDKFKEFDRIRLSYVLIAVRLEKFDEVNEILSKGFVTVREGEESPTDAWFEMKARLLLRERGLVPTEENLSRALDEVWDTLEPPIEIDFRQSYDRRLKYNR